MTTRIRQDDLLALVEGNVPALAFVMEHVSSRAIFFFLTEEQAVTLRGMGVVLPTT